MRTKAVTFSLSQEEIKDLETISENILGYKNKSGLIRFWIQKEKKKYGKKLARR